MVLNAGGKARFSLGFPLFAGKIGEILNVRVQPRFTTRSRSGRQDQIGDDRIVV
jgi:hypothetical protein